MNTFNMMSKVDFNTTNASPEAMICMQDGQIYLFTNITGKISLFFNNSPVIRSMRSTQVLFQEHGVFVRSATKKLLLLIFLKLSYYSCKSLLQEINGGKLVVQEISSVIFPSDFSSLYVFARRSKLLRRLFSRH